MGRRAAFWQPVRLRRERLRPFSDSFSRDSLKTLEHLKRRPYELPKWDTESLFLQCYATKTHAPEATERHFRQSL
jgi:hypothetical protein